MSWKQTKIGTNGILYFGKAYLKHCETGKRGPFSKMADV